MVRSRRRLGFEVKRTTGPSTNRSMRSAQEPLGLDRLDLIHAGEHTFPLAGGVRAVAFDRISEDRELLA